ncbi:MAG: preprotein translocase subunit SecY, partial [Spirochaetia bacterium]|nr:preprotein translocase subunit SecY [Spirochaetia bacterium]
MANSLVDVFRIKDLRKRIGFTALMLILFRLGATLPIPGINVNALRLYFLAQEASSSTMGLTEYLNFFAGGAFKNFSVFMLGIMPYISTQIIMQLLMIVFPSLKKLAEEDGGRKKIQKLTRYGTIVLALLQSYVVTVYAKSIPDAVTMNMLPYTIIAMITVTSGTMFLVWIGEQITAKGIGNGISLLIFAGIVARIPTAIITLVKSVQTGVLNPVVVI